MKLHLFLFIVVILLHSSEGNVGGNDESNKPPRWLGRNPAKTKSSKPSKEHKPKNGCYKYKTESNCVRKQDEFGNNCTLCTYPE
mmetsp:Transcript_13979/g.13557  ORF Transcript_13979/g.13557 Transcript_13979/m.13557 type:complete len:84 (-) Transcript_13979:2177-2428(-)